MDEYDEYYESYDDAAEVLDLETINTMKFDDLYLDIKKCRYISWNTVRETMRLNSADAPFGFEM
jgi:hypothetical protein